MDCSVPSEADQLNRAIDGFIEQEVEPPEREYDQFLGPDYEKFLVDEDHRQVPAYREEVETIRQKSVEAGYYGMVMPESVGGGGGGVDVLTRAIVGEHVANRPPGFHRAMFGGAAPPTPILLGLDEDQRAEYLEPVMAGEKTMPHALPRPWTG